MWQKLFGGINVQKTLNGVGGWVDGLNLTDQERIDYTLKYIKATTGYDLARRLIALSIIWLFIVLVLTATVLVLIESDKFDKIFLLIKEVVYPLVLTLMVFYYSGGIIKKAKEHLK